MQVPFSLRVLAQRHPFALHHFRRRGRRDPGNRDGKLALVERLDLDRGAAERVRQAHLRRVHQVVPFPPESLVGLLLDHEDDVPGPGPGALVPLALEADFRAGLPPGLDVDRQDFFLAHGPARCGVDHRPRQLDALGGPREELLEGASERVGDVGVFFRRLLLLVLVLASSSETAAAHAAAAAKEVLKAPASAAAAHPAHPAHRRPEKLAEDVLGGARREPARSAAAAHAAAAKAPERVAATGAAKAATAGASAGAGGRGPLLQALLAVNVVDLPLVRVAQDLVGLGDELELVRRGGVALVFVLFCFWKKVFFFFFFGRRRRGRENERESGRRIDRANAPSFASLSLPFSSSSLFSPGAISSPACGRLSVGFVVSLLRDHCERGERQEEEEKINTEARSMLLIFSSSFPNSVPFFSSASSAFLSTPRTP